MLRVAFHMTLKPTVTATDPPQYAEEDAAADQDLDPSTMSCEDQQKLLCSEAIFDNFWAKTAKSETMSFHNFA